MTVFTIAMGVIAMNSDTAVAIRAWCGATFLWRPGRLAPPFESRVRVQTRTASEEKRERFDSSPPHYLLMLFTRNSKSE
jgi:hypothetical protein